MAERAHAARQRTHAREYELVYILKSTVGPTEAKKVADRISDVADKQGAKIIKVDNWGRRKLAYQIDRHKRGVYVLVSLVGFGDVISEIERNLRILDPVLRFQTIRTDRVHNLAELTIDPEEVEFQEVEAADDDGDDPTFEEQLGMRSRQREPKPEEPKPKAEGDEAKGDEAKGDEAKAEGDEAKGDEAKAEGDEAKGDEAKADEAKADEAKADAADTSGAEGEAKKPAAAKASEEEE